MGVWRLCFLLYHPVNADLSEELYTTEVQRDGGVGNEAKHSKAYEVFTVGQAKCITYINSMYPQVGWSYDSLYYTDEEMVQSG